jgi:hypothetical protein
MKPLLTPDRPGPFTITATHLKILFGAFLFGGIAFAVLLVKRAYEIITDPYSFPFGNTKENPWVYTAPGVYLSICIPAVVFELAGAALIIWGQLKENKKLSFVGLALIVTGIAACLITGVIE